MAEIASGVLKRRSDGSGVLRNPKFSFRPDPSDVVVPPKLVRRLGDGATIAGPTRNGKRGRELASIETWAESTQWMPSESVDGSPGFDEGDSVPTGRQRTGDSNQDGHLDVSDAVHLLRRLFGGIVAEPETSSWPW